MKKKYQGNIFSLKTQIETIKQLYINDAIYGNNNKNKTYSLQKENISMKNELEELKLKMEKLNEEVAYLVKFLISDEAKFINNTVIRIDGGQKGSC